MATIHSFINRLQKAFVPAAYHLACNSVKERYLGGVEQEVYCLKQLSSSFRTAVDIGANNGGYTYKMSRLFDAVWAFEPNATISEPIKSAALANVNLIEVALSSEEGEGVLKLPVVKGQALPGWASLNPQIGESFQEIEIKIRTLDSFGLSAVDFIKIDVEGLEMNVLRGGAQTIEACRPTCLIEVDNSDVDALMAFFRERDYSAHRSWRGVTISRQNLLFAPNEIER